MLDFLNMVGVVLFVVFFFGFCVFIHELGHFLAAKWCGLHINAFSIGFKKAWGKKIDGIDYRIGWLPFGGYVDLPQVDATGSDIQDEEGNPLPPGKPMARIITAVAGPIFNILFGLALGCVIWHWGVPQDSSKMSTIIVEDIIDGAPSQRAGLVDGDKIVKLNGETFNKTWGKFLESFILAAGKTTLTVERDGKEVDITFQAEVNPNNEMLKSEGIASPWFSPVIPAIVYPQLGEHASKAGMKAGDIIVEINGKPVKRKMDALAELDLKNKKVYNITVMRNGALVALSPFESVSTDKREQQVGTMFVARYYHPIFKGIAEDSVLYKKGVRDGDEITKIDGEYLSNFEDLEDTFTLGSTEKIVSITVTRDGTDIDFKDILIPSENSSSSETVQIAYERWIEISEVFEDTPASLSGIKAGDRIIKINNEELNGSEHYRNSIQAAGPEGVELAIVRDSREIVVTVKPKVYEIQDIGFEFAQRKYPTPVTQFTDVISNSYRSLKAVGTGILFKMGFSDQKTSLGLKNFSGPVGISTMIGKIVSRGSYLQGLAFIVMITFSLGMLNLLPLPVLDGGHIVMAGIQIVIRRPLPAKLVQPLMNACAFMLISFMLYVTVYDVLRLKGESTPGTATTITVAK